MVAHFEGIVVGTFLFVYITSLPIWADAASIAVLALITIVSTIVAVISLIGV
jgi:hypothetical protein